NLTLAGGRGTGSAAGGDLLFATSDPGASGTSPESLTTKMIVKASGLVGIGTTNPCSGSTSNCKLAVKGAIRANEVVVDTNWSDYVFDADYRLAPLSDVAAYVKDNHHLPDIPSAAEVADKGVSLGDMQAKLLAKVEELTLHMIQLEKENTELRRRVARIDGGEK